jgi:VIT1/CCC1 family predicted Fe2+/Mn2+ transporter
MELSKAALYRNIAFGVQDAVVTTTGVLAASAGVPGVNVFRAGLVSVVASSFSMAVGAYQSERSAELATARDDVDIRRSELIGSAVVMFLSYMITGALVIIPWRVAGGRVATAASVLIAASLLAASAAFVSRDLPVEHVVRNVAEMLALGLVAVGGAYAFSSLTDKGS